MPLTFKLRRSEAQPATIMAFFTAGKLRSGALAACQQCHRELQMQSIWQGFVAWRCGFCATSVQNSPHWESATLFKP